MASPPSDYGEMSGIRKAAILSIVLGDAVTSEALKHLTEDESEAIGREVAKIQAITGDQIESVLEDCYQMVAAHDYVLKGGIEYARKLLISAYGPEQAKKMLDRVMKALGTEMATFDALQKADPQQLAKFIHSEHPQTIALCLSLLNSSQPSGLLLSLPPEIR